MQSRSHAPNRLLQAAGCSGERLAGRMAGCYKRSIIADMPPLVDILHLASSCPPDHETLRLAVKWYSHAIMQLVLQCYSILPLGTKMGDGKWEYYCLLHPHPAFPSPFPRRRLGASPQRARPARRGQRRGYSQITEAELYQTKRCNPSSQMIMYTG